MSVKRIFADANLFLRYLTNDIPEQASEFDQLLRRAAAGDINLITNSMVLAEIVWTLETYYRLAKEIVQTNLLAILNTPGLEIGEGEIILRAIVWYAEKNVDFIDAYNAAWMMDHGIEIACTFDRKHYSRFESLKTIAPGDY